MSMILPADAGAFSVLMPLISNGKVVEIFPSPVLAWVVDETGVTGIVTPTRIFPAGTPIWTPEGLVESEGGIWPGPEEYLKHLQRTLLS
jgi:hypothetical protein